MIWKSKAGKQLPIAIARELIKTGYTARAVTGFRGRSGRSFRAHLAMSQTEEGKWRVEFNEAWAREGAKPPDAEAEAEQRATPRRRRPRAPRSVCQERRRAGRHFRRPAQAGRGVSGTCARMDAMPITLITGPANAGKARRCWTPCASIWRTGRSRCWSCRRALTWSTTGASWRWRGR